MNKEIKFIQYEDEWDCEPWEAPDGGESLACEIEFRVECEKEERLVRDYETERERSFKV